MENVTMFQFFHWYSTNDGTWWDQCASQAAHLASRGITHMYLPPAYKSAFGTEEAGYAVYDLFDLGEFEQKGTVRTKYGTRDQYLHCIKKLHESGMLVIADIVLNHRMGGDEKEKMPVRTVNPDDRTQVVSDEHEIEAHTKFHFPGRNGKYSEFIWDFNAFSGVESEAENDNSIHAILTEHGDNWEPLIENELGNFDYLMGADVAFRNPNVREELKYWGRWYIETAGINGFRMDAVKHMAPYFIAEWLDHLRGHFNRDFFCVSEYWRPELQPLLEFLNVLEDRTQLFDVPLHYNFNKASQEHEQYDLRAIFEGTLVQQRPEMAVTFVDNHDTQPLQSLESFVDFWFKPHAYALILLREQGVPCVFYPAYYGANYSDKKDGEEQHVELVPVPCLDIMLLIRKALAFGMQRDYFDHPNTVGWTRGGVDEHLASGCAVLISNGEDGDKQMEMGDRNAGQTYYDSCGNRGEKVVLDDHGVGTFFVKGGMLSVWVREDARERIRS